MNPVEETLRIAVKELLIPGSWPFLLAGQLVGVALLYAGARGARWGRRWLVGLLVLYVVLSLQGTSDLLVAGLTRGYSPVRTAADARGADVIVVLGNGVTRIQLAADGVDVFNDQSAYNVIEAVRIYRLIGSPTVIASGGGSTQTVREAHALGRALRELGVPGHRVVLEDRSYTTRQQAVEVSNWLKQHNRTALVLVTAPEHMRRAMGVFASHGIRPIPSMSGVRYGGQPFWLPTRYALGGSKNAIYEYLAVGYYRVKGWM